MVNRFLRKMSVGKLVERSSNYVDIKDLEVITENGSELWCLCPFHQDKKRPNFLVSKTGKYAGYGKCFACGKFCRVNVEGKVRMSKLKDRPIALNWEALSKAYRRYRNIDYYLTKLAYKWDVSYRTIRGLECGWNGEAWTIAVRNELCDIVGIQRIYPNGDKKLVSGSRVGVFIPTFLRKSIVGGVRGFPVLICEGVSDTAVALDLGFNVIGRLSCTCGNEILKTLIKGMTVIIVSDNDKPGRKGAQKLATDLTKYNKVGIIYPDEHSSNSVENIKDLRDWVQICGKQNPKRYIKNTTYVMSQK